MRRRLDLAMTLVGDPRVIFLDEPTTGLDPRSRRLMWQTIRELVAGGVTIFLTTQYLEEADELADRIAVLDEGRLVAEGTAEELKRRRPRRPRTPPVRRRRRPRRRGARSSAGGADDEALALQVPSDGGVRALRAAAGPAGPGRRSRSTTLSVHTPDLDDVFLALTGHTTAPKEVSPMSDAISDAMTMLRRNVRHTQRNPGAIIMTIGLPVVLSAVVRRGVRRRAERRASGRPGGATTTSTTWWPGCC